MALTNVKNRSLYPELPWRRGASKCQAPFMVLALCLLAASLASGQELTATFYPQESVYLSGEPVWFVFKVTNAGDFPLYFEYANPYGVCAFFFGYWFEVPGARATGRWQCGYGGSCAGGGPKLLAPHSTFAQRLLLNQWFVIDHTGSYHVSAKRMLRYSSRTENTYALLAPSSRTFTSEFDVTIKPGERSDVDKALEPFVKNLNSRDFDLNVEAVETITAMAPPFLEKTIITLANHGDSFTKARAIPALGRLNTAESRRALARLVENRVGWYSWQAIDTLAQTGDRTYIPLLAELAKEPAWQNFAIPALGELGGRKVVPVLVPLVHHSLGPPNEPPIQQLAIRGLANTASQEAVPYLIDALRDPLVHRDAVNALEQITHLVIREGKSQRWLYTDDDATAAKLAERWERWWKSAGKGAKLYGPGDCTNSVQELPM